MSVGWKTILTGCTGSTGEKVIPSILFIVSEIVREQSDAVRLAVRDVEPAVRRGPEAVRARQPAGQRIGLRAIATLAGAQDGRDDARPEVDGADGVVLGIGD